MKYSDVIIRSSCPQNRPCRYAGGCVCHRALHKGPCTGRQGLGLIPTWLAKCTGCFLVMEPPEGASSSNCRKAAGVLTTALPAPFAELWKSPILAAASCRGHVHYIERGEVAQGTAWQRFGQLVFPTPVSREHLPAALLQAGCSHRGAFTTQG